MDPDNDPVLEAAMGESEGTQYLNFWLADELYGLNILHVQEIHGWETATPIPNAPLYVKGVINLRGTIVPVIDLRRRFELADREYTKETVVIVIRTAERGGAERSPGPVVDAVSDVFKAQDDDIVGTPDFGAGVPTEKYSACSTTTAIWSWCWRSLLCWKARLRVRHRRGSAGLTSFIVPLIRSLTTNSPASSGDIVVFAACFQSGSRDSACGR